RAMVGRSAILATSAEHGNHHANADWTSARQERRQGPDGGNAAQDRHADAAGHRRAGQFAFARTFRWTDEREDIAHEQRATERQDKERKQMGPAEQHDAEGRPWIGLPVRRTPAHRRQARGLLGSAGPLTRAARATTTGTPARRCSTYGK